MAPDDLVIEPLQEPELGHFIRLYWDAFEPPSADMILPMLYPKGFHPDLEQRMRTRILRNTQGDLGSSCFCAKRVSTGEIVGVSWWTTVLHPRSKFDIDERFEAAYQRRNIGPEIDGFNAELDRAFFRANFYTEAEVTDGQPYMTLMLLATSPKHQRTGAGTLLLEHGLRKADELKLPVFLHSSVGGRKLYERYGFEVKREFPLDCTQYGGRSKGAHWCMMRPANPQNGI